MIGWKQRKKGKDGHHSERILYHPYDYRTKLWNRVPTTTISSARPTPTMTVGRSRSRGRNTTPRPMRTSSTVGSVRSRSRSMSISSVGSNKRRKTLGSNPGGHHGHAAAGSVRASSTIKGVMKLKKKKGVEIKKKKHVRISKVFKTKVHEALAEKMIHGCYQATWSGGSFRLQNLLTDTQAPLDGIGSGVNDGVLMFSTDAFAQAASILWNGLLATGATAEHNPDTTGSFLKTVGPAGLKFNVKKSSTSFEFKNNSTRVLTLKIYECAPRRCSAYSNDTPTGFSVYKWSGGAWAAATLLESLQIPTVYWTKALVDDFQAGASATTQSGASTALSQSILGLTPHSSPTFNKGWKYSYRSVILEPGQGEKFTITGPSDLELNYEKYLSDGIYMNIQKFTRGLMVVVSQDILAGATTGSARAVSGLTTQCLGMERIDHFQLEMPESAAVNKRKDYYVKNVFPGVVTGAAQGIETENPTAQIPG